MKLLAWNCRGVNKAPTVRVLKTLNRECSPDILFLAETKALVQRIDSIKERLGFVECFCVEANGSAGGLALFWKKGVELEVVHFDHQVISALIYSDPPSSTWLLNVIRGPPERKMRKGIWSFMESIIKAFSGPWLIIGDFNSICSSEDKRGGNQGENYSANWFKNFMFNTGAIDLDFFGPQFTWSNKREGLANIKERLDRGVCDQDWQSMFPKAGIRHLGAPKSDHRPILLDTHLDNLKIIQPFRFEAMWTKDTSSIKAVETAWDVQVEGSQGFQLAKKIRRVKVEMQKWNKSCFGFAKSKIKDLERMIEEVRGRDPTERIWNSKLLYALNWKNGWRKRKSNGSKNQGSFGSEKGIAIPGFFTCPPLLEEEVIGLTRSNWKMEPG
jgi:exonuclease III